MLMIVGTALVSTVIAVNLNALRSVYGFSGTETSLIVTVCSATALAVSFGSDKYFEKLGLRLGMTIAAISGMISFLLHGLADGHLFVYYIAAMFGGVTYSLGMILPASMLMRRWFNKSRGLALSISSAGTGISSAIWAPGLQSIIESASIQTAFFVESAFFGIIAIICFSLLKNDPSDMGLEPYGGNDYVPAGKHASRAGRYAVGSGIIALIVVLAAIAGMCGSPATSNIVLCFTTEGLDSMKVAFGMSIYGVLLIFSKIIYGEVVDRRGACFATVIFTSLIAAGQFCCFMIGFFNEETLMFLSFILLGSGYAVVTLGYPNWAAELVSKEEYPKKMKRFQIGFQFGTLVGSAIPGIIADITGHYTWAYLMFAILFVIMIISVLFIYRNAKDISTAIPNQM